MHQTDEYDHDQIRAFAKELANALYDIGQKYPEMRGGEFLSALEAVIAGSVASVFEGDIIAIRDYADHLKSHIINVTVALEDEILETLNADNDD
jgi:hypothetical protein